MTISLEIMQSAKASVLCWLATSTASGQPNVSPKEIFAFHANDLVIANIASPKSAHNILENKMVCVSFIDIFIQKGWQLNGHAEVIKKSHPLYDELSRPLLNMTAGMFAFSSVFLVKIESAKEIIAPKYWLYPETTEQDQIESAKKAYKF